MRHNTFDRPFSSFCWEIDELKAEVSYWREKYEALSVKNAGELQERLEDVQRSLDNALVFALSVRDDGNGNLVIEKEDRKLLAETYKK